MGLGRFKPGCCSGCDAVCISLKSYKFLCCEQRTYIYVSSPCDIDEIRINGEVVANPGTNEYGGLPVSAPVVSIDGDDVTGVLLAAQECGSCPAEEDQQADPPTAIAVTPTNCRYDVEVDTCGTTYYCSLEYCLARTLTLYDLSFPGYSSHDECDDMGASPEDPVETHHEVDLTIDPFSFNDIQIDFCIPSEDSQESESVGFSAENVVTTVSTLVGTNVSTTTYSGTVKLFFHPYVQCDYYFSTGGLGSDRYPPELLFTGTITTVTTGPTVPGGSITTSYSATNFPIGYLVFSVCGGLDGALGIIFGFGCTGFTKYHPIDTPDDFLRCFCQTGAANVIGNYSWCM